MIDFPARDLFFDLDGTLFQSEADIRSAWHRTFAELNIDVPGFDRVFKVGPSLQDIAKELFEDLPAERFRQVVATFKRNYDQSELPNTLPYPGVDRWLKSLHAAGHRLFTMTNKRMAPTGMLMARNGWTGIFAEIIGGDYFGEALPKRELLRRSMSIFNCDPAGTLMVGDTNEDIVAGRFAGTMTCFCRWGYGVVADKLHPDFTVDLPEVSA